MQALLQQPEGDIPEANLHISRDEDGSNSRWHKVAHLLGRKYDRIDPVRALQLMPLQVPLHYPTECPGCASSVIFVHMPVSERPE